MRQVGVAIVGTGWCGGIRAETCAAHPLTKSLHIAEIRPERLAEVARATAAKSAVTDYGELLKMGEIEAVYISATPETTHYPMARDCLAAVKHVFLEKPIAMERTHDLDFVLWCLEPAKPVRVYSQANYGAMQASSGAPIADTQWITVTMDSGLSFVVGGGWSLPPGYPNFSTTWIEMVGTEGALLVDDSHRDVVLNTMEKGMQLPMSTMPGERVEHTYAGPMPAETVHFLE